MKKLLLLIIIPLVFFFGCETEDNTTGYNCAQSGCVESPNGYYLNLEDCENNCDGWEDITNDNIHQAVDEWLEDPVLAEATYGHISNWDVSSVTDMGWLFGGSSFNQEIGDWDVSNVTDMDCMFLWCPFDQDISGWDVGNVIACSAFNSGLNTSFMPNFTNCNPSEGNCD